MRARAMRRSALLAIGTLLMAAAPVVADTVSADADVIAGVQNSVDLGAVAPGTVIERDVTFTLVCAGLRHADPGQTVTLTVDSVTIPEAGGSIGATDGIIGPVPDTWVSDVNGIVSCPFKMSLDSSTPSHVTLVAPTTPGLDYVFTILYAKSLAPSGAADSTSLTETTGVSFVVDVVAAPPDTTPPVLSGMPSDVTAETTDSGGMSIAYDPPTATDDTDPAPVVGCDPPSGSIFAIGATTVTCTATDTSGNIATGMFTVTVNLVLPPDTTPPVMSGLPSGVEAWTDDPAGVSVTFDPPTATDDRDPAPVVACEPASGSLFAVGSTTVTCTASDVSGNSSTGTFDVTVYLVPDATPPVLSALPADVDVLTMDPAGQAVTYAAPTAIDARDPSPTVACAPASGTIFPVGTTTVTCTATDAAGNMTSGTFLVTVHLVSADWGGQSGPLTVKAGRPVHLAAQALVDGTPVGGTGSFVVAACSDGATELSVDATWQDGSAAWTAKLETDGLALGCHRVTLVVDGTAFGSFDLIIEPKGKPSA
jgi:hypothetical protein